MDICYLSLARRRAQPLLLTSDVHTDTPSLSNSNLTLYNTHQSPDTTRHHIYIYGTHHVTTTPAPVSSPAQCEGRSPGHPCNRNLPKSYP